MASNIQPGSVHYSGGANVIVIPSVGGSRSVEYARRKKAIFAGLAWTELALGACLVIIGIALLPICFNSYYCARYYFTWIWTVMSTNLWGGVLFVAFATVGVVQAYKPTECLIAANLALSIVGSIIAATCFALEITAAVMSYGDEAVVALHSVACVFDFALIILFIVSASYAGAAGGCCGGCCCDSSPQEVVAHIPYSQQSQTVILPNGQNVFVPSSVQPAPHMIERPANFVLPGAVSPSYIPPQPGHGAVNYAYDGERKI